MLINSTLFHPDRGLGQALPSLVCSKDTTCRAGAFENHENDQAAEEGEEARSNETAGFL
jgi:hypothetical protein